MVNDTIRRRREAHANALPIIRAILSFGKVEYFGESIRSVDNSGKVHRLPTFPIMTSLGATLSGPGYWTKP
jgi:hypothetical protein